MKYQRGVALIIVLWITVLLSVVVGSYLLLARTESLQARNLVDSTRARLAAEAGIHRAVIELRNPDLEQRWFGDGRAYTFNLEDMKIEVRVRDETGLIDINLADEQMLERLLEFNTDLEESERTALVQAILDYRDSDDLPRLDGAEADEYAAAGLPYGPKNAPFDTVAELQQVLGMNWRLFQQLEPAITVHSGRPNVNPAFAPAQVLQLLPGMDPELARQYVEQRHQVVAGSEPLPALPDGTQPLAQGGGLTYSIRSRATLPNGTWTEVYATIRQGGGLKGRPFRYLRLKKDKTDAN